MHAGSVRSRDSAVRSVVGEHLEPLTEKPRWQRQKPGPSACSRGRTQYLRRRGGTHGILHRRLGRAALFNRWQARLILALPPPRSQPGMHAGGGACIKAARPGAHPRELQPLGHSDMGTFMPSPPRWYSASLREKAGGANERQRLASRHHLTALQAPRSSGDLRWTARPRSGTARHTGRPGRAALQATPPAGAHVQLMGAAPSLCVLKHCTFLSSGSGMVEYCSSGGTPSRS